ncbi:MAG: hypothetical protein GY888_16480, partial [Planctomycetaceae bacterium]|nr:hypothetical protein [Planctomycetaceae bacterium]
DFGEGPDRHNAELEHWDVTNGTVDVLNADGREELGWDSSYKHNLDMDGSSADGAIITTKQAFVLEPGFYRLEFDASGDVWMTESFSYGMTGLFNQDVEVLYLTHMQYEFEITETTTSRIYFDHDHGADNAGPRLDNITLSRIGLDQNIYLQEDAGLQVIKLYDIQAGGGESQHLRVTASSSNTGLIPAPTVDYSSPDSTGTVRFTPLPDQFGTTIITITVEDGGDDNDLSTANDNLTFSHDINVTVYPVDDAPLLDPINDVTIQEDSAEQTIDLTGIFAGPGGESQPLRVTASSDDTSLTGTPTVDYNTPDSTGTVR